MELGNLLPGGPSALQVKRWGEMLLQPSLGLQARDAPRAVASAQSEWLESVGVSSFCGPKSALQKRVPRGGYFLSLLEEAAFFEQ